MAPLRSNFSDYLRHPVFQRWPEIPVHAFVPGPLQKFLQIVAYAHPTALNTNFCALGT
jgi:hypothetical protein